MAAPARAPSRAKTHYEIYVAQHGRLELHDVSEDRELALASARRLAARPDTLVRVMRESYDPDRDETVERIVFDSAVELPPDPSRPADGLAAAPARQPPPRGQRPAQPQDGVPALVVIFGGLSLAAMLAAASLALF